MVIKPLLLIVMVLYSLMSYADLHAANDSSQLNTLINSPEPQALIPASDQELRDALTRMFDTRLELLLLTPTRTPDLLPNDYILTDDAGRMALLHERRRSQYIRTWADKRNIRMMKPNGVLQIKRLRRNGVLARAEMIHTVQLSYTYPLHPQIPPQSFGLGTKHRVILKLEQGVWKLLHDEYSDPLYVNPELIPADGVPGFPAPVMARTPAQHPNARWRIDQAPAGRPSPSRARAVAYADRYAGSAWGAGNLGEYNAKYKDYTDYGGDCTNFISQVWGDTREGGGLPQTSLWHYSSSRGGSSAWIHTDLFKQYLLESKEAELIAEGTFREVVQSTAQFPDGAVASLRPGDLIAYSSNQDVDHFAVVVGYDQNGYPLVDAHTSDRYHTPFDLGWTRRTEYLLFHMQDAE